MNTLPAWNGKIDFNGSLPSDGSLLKINDGTGNIPVTMEFDWDDDVGLGISLPTNSIYCQRAWHGKPS